MPPRKTTLLAALAAAWIAGWIGPQIQAATLTKVEWQTGTEAGTESLVLRFSDGIPGLDAGMESWGLGVWLPGIKLDTIEAEGIRVTGEAAGARLRVERPGMELRAVRIEGDSVRLLLSRRAPLEATPSSSYRIGVGDVISVAVYKNPDLSGDFTVAADGTLNIPLVGTILVRGLSDVELAERLREILAKDFLVDPQVTVTVKTYLSQWAHVTGAVPRSMRVALSPGMTFKDILSEAGVALAPGQQIVLSHAGGSGQTLTIVAETLESADLPPPRDGVVLTVQDPAYVFVQGEVRRPGRLALTPSMTLLQAIALAEGLTEWAGKKDVRVRRTLGGETTEEIVNLKKVEERKAPDVELKAGDIILVRRKVL